MRLSVPSCLVAQLVLTWSLTLQANPAQAPAEATGKKQIVKPQIAQQFVAAVADRATLTLTSSAQIMEPNQPIHFSLTWSRPVYRYTYTFDWGDGSGSQAVTALAADHAYSSPGQFIVRVTGRPITGLKMAAANSIASNSVAVLIQKPENPSATLIASNPNPRVGDEVTFTAEPHPSASDAQFTFEFGDGTQSQPPFGRAAHTYSAPGVYRATVTIQTHDGEQSAVSPPVEVSVSEVRPTPPTLEASLENKGLILTGQEVLISATLSPPQKRQSFEVDWNDGSPLEKVSAKGLASHPYRVPGSYEVVVTAETEQNYSPPLQNVLTINVSSPPTPIWWFVAILALTVPTAVILWRRIRKRDADSRSVKAREKINSGRLSYTSYRFHDYDYVLNQAFERKERIYSAAYIMPSGGSGGETRKHRTHLRLLERMMSDRLPAKYVSHPGSSVHRVRWRSMSKTLGPFTLRPGLERAEHQMKFKG